LTSEECENDGGRAEGHCAAGFGVCCVFVRECDGDETVVKNGTYVRNVGYPRANMTGTECTFNVDRINDGESASISMSSRLLMTWFLSF